ncbi:hypothetical protein KAI46_06505, partial [bacterium]|nr:hypothetical protein [bacterium]
INFFMAQAHRQRASDFMARKDEMGEAIQTVKAASTGIESATDLLMSAKSTAQAALLTSETSERDSLADQFDTFRTQLNNLVEDSGYKGVNLLEDGSELTVNFNEKETSSITIAGFDASASGLGINETTTTTETTIETTTTTPATEIVTTVPADFLGDEVTLVTGYNVTGEGSPWVNFSPLKTVTVTDDPLDTEMRAISGANESGDPYVKADVDLNSDFGVIIFTETGSIATAGYFNGIKIQDLDDQNGNTEGLTVTLRESSITGFDASRIEVGADFVNFNFQGLDVSVDERIVFEFTYTETTTTEGTSATTTETTTTTTSGWHDDDDIRTSIDEVNTAINTLRSQAKNLSNDLGTINTRQDFTSELINTLSDGADNLTLADINQEGANMLMLQT